MRNPIKHTVTHDHLLTLVPCGPAWQVDWAAIWSLWPELTNLDTCPQDPIHHAEGDVGTHTRMVVEALVADPDWQLLPDMDRANLFWAAVLHDVGKPAVTKHEDDGRISSRGHSRIGASIARELLWYAGLSLCLAGSSVRDHCPPSTPVLADRATRSSTHGD